MDEKPRYKKFHPELIKEAVLDPKKIPTDPRRVGLIYVNQMTTAINADIVPALVEKARLDLMNQHMPVYIAFSVIAAYLRKNDPVVYLVEKGFFEKFRKIRLDILQFQHLPREKHGFVQLPACLEDAHGNAFDGFYFVCGKRSEIERKGLTIHPDLFSGYEWSDELICLAYENKEGSTASFVFRPRPKGDQTMSLKKAFSDAKIWREVEPGSGDGNYEVDRIADGYATQVAVMLNLVAYIDSGSPDLSSYENSLRFRGPGSPTPINADRELSRSRLIRVGFNYLKEKRYTDDAWYSTAHLGWRRYGPRREAVRLSWIRGSSKRWHSREEEPEEPEDVSLSPTEGDAQTLQME